MDLTGRHPDTITAIRWFAYAHLDTSHQAIACDCYDLATRMIATLPDGPQLTSGLYRLLAARDSFIHARARQAAHQEVQPCASESQEEPDSSAAG